MTPHEESKPGWKGRLAEFSSAFRNIPRAFSLLWESDRANAGWLALITLVDGVMPLSHAWATKLIVDGVVRAMGAGVTPIEGLRRIAPYLALEFSFILVSSMLGQGRALVEQLIDHKLGHVINTRIIRKALSLEMRYFEDAAFYDKMQNARRQSEYRAMALVRGAFLLVQNIITLTSFLALLLAFNPWIAAILFCATMPAFMNQSRYSRLNFRLQTWRAPETRHMYYMESLLTQDTTMKEIKLFGLGEPLLKRYAEMFWKIFREDADLARSRSLKSLFWGLIGTVSYYGAYAWVIGLTVGKSISLGDMTLYIALFRQSQGAFEGMLGNVNSLFENGLFLENLFEFLGLKPQVASLDPATRPAEDPSRGIEFENVSFRYPGNEEWTIQDLSFAIKPGEKIAIVGENGAGKTTLIKLLTRLYEPTQGRVLFHGVDLRHFSMEEIHRRVGAIFQDFVHYHFTLRENIGFGWVEKLEEKERILRAAAKSGADEVAQALPHQYETRLGKQWDEGHELSGGQWQKVALARAFMREAEVLILDEPTSSLDAEAEYEIFQKFRELTQGRISLLVSHRFSTVRMADRILVLRGGKIEELGSHPELVARRGTYARLFEMQAEGYR